MSCFCAVGHYSSLCRSVLGELRVLEVVHRRGLRPLPGGGELSALCVLLPFCLMLFRSASAFQGLSSLLDVCSLNRVSVGSKLRFAERQTVAPCRTRRHSFRQTWARLLCSESIWAPVIGRHTSPSVGHLLPNLTQAFWRTQKESDRGSLRVIFIHDFLKAGLLKAG